MTAIGLLGDVMLGRGVAAELQYRPCEEVWDPSVRALAATLDLVVCNLECCLSDRGRPTSRISGKPFFFRGPSAGIAALQAIGVRAISLANNHALDFGPRALADTLATAAAAGVAAAGAGRGLRAARRPVVVSAGGCRVGLVAVTDHPREYAAGPGRWGVAYADLRDGAPDWLLREIAAVRERCDVVIAFPHWGPNMAAGPAPWQHGVAAELQSAGADLVAGHSAHIAHGVGWTARGPLLYDLGDALDDYAIDPVLRNDLGVLAVWRPGQAEDQLQLIGLRLEYARTALAAGAEAEWIAARLEHACREQGTRVEREDVHVFRVRPV